MGKNHVYHVAEELLETFVYITEKEGKSYARSYIFNDQPEIIYLDSLSVEPNFRKQGLGLELQLMRENIGLSLGCHISRLWVKKDTWMYTWYLRRGYETFNEYKAEENAVWMEKILLT